jgi:hypothetical protein
VREREREYLNDLKLFYILPWKLSAILRRVLRRCRSARAYDPCASVRSNTAARPKSSACLPARVWNPPQDDPLHSEFK